ncbi:MAG TPA: rRNA maturation RNase YbeY [Rhizomicrobium sp.]
MSLSVHLEFAEPRWRKIRGLSARLTLAAERALKKAKAPRKGALTILLTDDAQLKALNRDFRGKDKPTNVLSFPAAANGDSYLGDVALAYGTTQAEARGAGKRFADHATHLVVHGVLHLLGHDHEGDEEARAMEALEIAILAGLGIADPYRAEAA